MYNLYCPHLLLNLNTLRNYQVPFFGSLTSFFSGNHVCIVPTHIQRSSKNPNRLLTLMERMACIKLIETETMRTSPTERNLFRDR